MMGDSATSSLHKPLPLFNEDTLSGYMGCDAPVRAWRMFDTGTLLYRNKDAT